MTRSSPHFRPVSMRASMRAPLAVLAALVLAFCAPMVRAQQASVSVAIHEAAAVQAVATAARLCSHITETELNRATNRIDQLEAAQLGDRDRETYLILRGSASFRNHVFAAALRRIEGGCTAEIGAAWKDVDASLIFASVLSAETMASTSAPDSATLK